MRVKDVDFDCLTVIVRCGKGGKDRAVTLPASLVAALRSQLQRGHVLPLREARRAARLPRPRKVAASDATNTHHHDRSHAMTRRLLLGLLAGLGLSRRTASAAPAATPTHPEPVQLSAAEWKQRLSAAQYEVLRREGTERPFSSALNGEKRAGRYLCAGCELPLFTSDMKFDSGTGWPSFHSTLAGAFDTSTDFKLGLPRTEYHCARCGGHHGHVFMTGRRRAASATATTGWR